MSVISFADLIIFEMANNHSGELQHGLRIINKMAAVSKDFPFRFAVKFQYRDLDSFIHPEHQQNSQLKYIRRFQDTRLSEKDFLTLKEAAQAQGFLTVCTAFDENSVLKIQEHGYDFLKVASCSFTDWPLLEKAVQCPLPMILSTAGASLDDIDRVVTFMQHRDKQFCLMHCVGRYPTKDAELCLDQIDFFQERYPGLPIGFSTHENPDAIYPGMLALAKGAQVLERHVGVADENHSLNAYSSTPQQIRVWLEALRQAKLLCGNCRDKRRDISAAETAELRGLQRGVFLRHDLPANTILSDDDFFFAMPNQPGQLLANDLSKYLLLKSKRELKAEEALMREDVEMRNTRSQVLEIVKKLCALLKKSGLHIQNKLDLELSHHFGLEHFHQFGCSIITVVNREYCKKIIMLLPGQKNPEHAHQRKEESFHLIYGDLCLSLDGKKQQCQPGDIVLVERGVKHDFSSENGAILEEISTRHYKNDSYYSDQRIGKTDSRKTYLTFYSDWLEGELR
ncbi:MAG: cupin domain-containing protein [Oligosphaeraceae bacterium]|nr:cupin domain-containing protein [Oligosphaeraceae bacterium]